MNYGTFKALVDEHLAVNANRRGTEALKARSIRNALVDLQRFIRGYRVGHTTVYNADDMDVQGCAMLGQFPSGCKPSALYIRKLTTSTGVVSPGSSQSGLDLTIASWAQLAAVPTSGIGLPFVKIWIEESTGLEHIVRLLAGTDATNTASGIQRPDDYDAASNARVWYQVGSAA